MSGCLHFGVVLRIFICCERKAIDLAQHLRVSYARYRSAKAMAHCVSITSILSGVF